MTMDNISISKAQIFVYVIINGSKHVRTYG